MEENNRKKEQTATNVNNETDENNIESLSLQKEGENSKAAEREEGKQQDTSTVKELSEDRVDGNSTTSKEIKTEELSQEIEEKGKMSNADNIVTQKGQEESQNKEDGTNFNEKL